MLEPQDRTLLLDPLKPPPGYDLSLAVGTTYSLDLLALLTAPVAFTLYDQETIQKDPIGLMHTMRQYAGRIRIFCQAGQIKIPDQHQILYSYLEDSVYEVLPPHEEGVFHPKVWALRFESEGEHVLYRLLVLSRNLTFDRSWDTSLVLEGKLTHRKYRFSVNYPLGDFFHSLPEMAVQQVPDKVMSEVEKVVYEIQRVNWSLPSPFSEVRFWSLGLPHMRRKWPFEGRVDRMMVVSPFLSASTLYELTEEGKNHVLVSRAESLEELDDASFSCFHDVFALDPNIAAEEEIPEVEEDILRDVPFSGLHAKLYIADMGWDARLWTGSANATGGGFGKNVEFLVELLGRKSKIGIDTLLQESKDGQVLFRDLLQEISQAGESQKVDEVQRRLESILHQARSELIAAGFELVIEKLGEEEFNFTLRVPGKFTIPEDVSIGCWPITLDEERYRHELRTKTQEIRFGPCSLHALTSFLAFEIQAKEEGETLKSRFVLNLPMHGVPEKRPELILQSLLQNREQVLRYLFMLLQEEKQPDFESAIDVWRYGKGDGFYGKGGTLELPLLETMMRALSRNPAQLDKVYQLIEDLRKTDQGEALLPDHFDAIWKPIWEARMKRREER